MVQRLLDQAGGKLEAFYFAFGEADAYIIADLPDASLRTAPLLSPDEMDLAAKKAVDAQPGSGGPHI